MSSIDRLLEEARRDWARMEPRQAADAMRHGALLIDTRPAVQRERDGEITGAICVDRNVLEWRLDPTSPHRIPEITGHDQTVIVICNEGILVEPSRGHLASTWAASCYRCRRRVPGLDDIWAADRQAPALLTVASGRQTAPTRIRPRPTPGTRRLTASKPALRSPSGPLHYLGRAMSPITPMT